MNLKPIRNIFLLAFSGLSAVVSEAQNSNTLCFLKDVPQAASMNPSFCPESNFVVGLPVLSGVNIGFNNDFRLNNTVQKGNGVLSDTLRFNFDKLYNVTGEHSKINFELNASMFYLGVRKGKNFYSFTVNEKGFFRGQFDKNFIEYFKNGIKSYYGSNTGLGNISFNIGQYREFGFGLSHKAGKKLMYGTKLKILFGRLNMNSDQVGFQIHSIPGDQKLYFIPSGDVNISGPVRFEKDTVDQGTRMIHDLNAGDYVFNFRNLGFAADLGMNYQVNSQLNLSASLIDLGFLRFTKKNFLMNVGNSLIYDKENLTQASQPDSSDFLSSNAALYAFRDSIPYMTSAKPIHKAQLVPLPAKFYFGGEYSVGREWTLGLTGKLYFLREYFYSAVTLSARTYLSDRFLFTFSNTLIRNSFVNPGAGFEYKSGLFNIYFATDNIFSLTSASYLKNLNLQFGINLLLGNE